MASDSRIDRSFSVKVSDAKDFGAEIDTYVVVNHNFVEKLRTKTIFNSNLPSFEEEIHFDIGDELEEIDIVLWESGHRFAADRPLGKIVLTAQDVFNSQEQQEKWLPLTVADTEGTVSGTLELELLLAPMKDNKTTLTVNVIGGRDLVSRDVNGLSDPYVVLHILPDLEAKTTQATKIKKKTLNPKYGESFTFEITAPNNQLPLGSRLHVSCWDWDRFTDDDFMGFSVLNLKYLTPGIKTTRSLVLRPKPASIRETESEGSKKEGKGYEKARHFVMDSQALTPEAEHPKAQGSIRLKYKFTEEVVLHSSAYDDLIKVISDNSFLLPVVLGKVSLEREAAAWSLVKTFKYYGDAVTCLTAIIDHEVSTTAYVNTIFRGNSMASKGIDVYMKLIALPYLSATIGEAVKELITSKKNCEVDPTRLEKGEDLKKNWKHLKGAVNAFADAIFKSSSSLPSDLVSIFTALRNSVKKQFPDDNAVQYTAISGFIFLRLFVAATMSPTLFNLWPEQVDKRTGRALTLVAKTLQNLANLVEFGQKEEYMTEMNSLILDRIVDVKKFIDEISSGVSAAGKEKEEKVKERRKASFFSSFSKTKLKDDTPSTSAHINQLVKIDVAKESSKLFHHFDRMRDKIAEEATTENVPPELIQQMNKTLDQLRPLHELPSDQYAVRMKPTVTDNLAALFVPTSTAKPSTTTTQPTQPTQSKQPAPKPSPSSPQPNRRNEEEDDEEAEDEDDDQEYSVHELSAEPVDMAKLSTNFSARYAFDFFDRRKEGLITTKDLGLILSLQGVNPRSADVEARLTATGVGSEGIPFEVFENLCKTILPSSPPPAVAVSDLAFKEAFSFLDSTGKARPNKKAVDRVLLFGPDGLSKGELSQLRRLALTHGMEQDGQVDIQRLLASEPSKPLA